MPEMVFRLLRGVNPWRTSVGNVEGIESPLGMNDGSTESFSQVGFQTDDHVDEWVDGSV